MSNYLINEIFYSLQGEGYHAGSPNVFIRLSHCNLTCNFCDTEFESGIDMTAQEIVDAVAKHDASRVILTGGEPLMQADGSLLKKLSEHGLGIAVETNGSIKPTKEQAEYIDWFTVSPKVAVHAVAKNFNGVKINELKYVRSKGQALPNLLERGLTADHYYLSPMASGDLLVRENLDWCINLIKENDSLIVYKDKFVPWRLTLQMHKVWSVR